MDIFGTGGFEGFMQPVIGVLAVLASPILLVVLFRFARIVAAYYWAFVSAILRFEGVVHSRLHAPASQLSRQKKNAQSVSDSSTVNPDWDVEMRRDL